MLSSSYSWYGLNNTFNMRGLYMDWAAGNSDNDQGAFATGFKNQLNLTEDNAVSNYIAVFTRTAFGFLGGETTFDDRVAWPNGYIKNYTALDLIKGYQTDQVSKWLNTGNFTAGNLYVSDIVTPTLNTFLGPTSELEWNMLMGRGTANGKVNVTISELGTTLGAKGNYGYVSIPQRMWNGVTG